MHIAVAGNIGAGKTTLTQMLARHYGWEMQLEDMDENPYINDFYDDMQRWSFNLQVYFLTVRWNNIQNIRKGEKSVIQDRTIYEDAYIFAPNLHAMGLMSTRDFDNYSRLFSAINQNLQQPDLLIYLRASIPKLVSNIQQRGREYEEAIRLDYLKRLNERYEAWISSYTGKMIIVNIDELDYQENPEHANHMIMQVEAALHGLF
ncbi:MAG: deoxynucleoside kinase [Bacteroidetes bacterium]|nr:deoxynucleoside kinase [Bacteroidota bacterium]